MGRCVSFIYHQSTDITLVRKDEWDYDTNKEILAAPNPHAINILN